MDYQQLLTENLPFVGEVIGTIARRSRLSRAEADEFTSFVHYRLVEHDYRILRKFQHRSQLGTYLVTVITRLFADYRNAEWGRWRPSAQARRLGPVAMLLDRLVSRDRHSLEEAIQIMRITHRVEESEETLRELWRRLPRREEDVELPLDQEVEDLWQPAAPSVDGPERDERAARTARALAHGAAQLGPPDRVLLRLHFLEGVTLADLARVHGVTESAMRRRWARIMGKLRQAFVAEGLDAQDFAKLIESGLADLPATFLDEDPDGA